MSSGSLGIQSQYHIQKVGDQYELLAVGRLRSFWVKWIRGEYTASKESLGRLVQVANGLSASKPEGYEMRLRSLVRSLAGMLEVCSLAQKEEVQSTLQAVRKLFPPAQDANPETSEEKLAIAQSIIERARAGKTLAHCSLAFLESKDKQTLSPLAQCFKEYFAQTNESDKELCRIIKAIYENGEDYGDALVRALESLRLGRRTTKDNPLPDREQTIRRAILLFARQSLEPCMKAFRNPQSKDFGTLLLRARQGIELVLSAGIPADCLDYAVLHVKSFFSRMVTEELNFSMTVARTSRRFLRPESTEEEEAKVWAATSPSMPLTQTLGRVPAIEIGGIPVKGSQSESQLMHAYRYSQALKGYLEQQGVSNAGEVANQLMLRCTVECSSDNLLKFLGLLLSLQPNAQLPRFVEDASELNEHPVIEPKRPTIRFSVEGGKCIIERVCPMQFGSQYAWRVSRAEFDPKKIGDQWTETVTTKPYAQALADEVQRRVTEEGKTRDAAIKEVQEAVGAQMGPGFELYQTSLEHLSYTRT
jgi:hypothetical protein